MDLRNQKFGIEIEMTGIKRKEAAEIINKYFKSKGNEESKIKYEGGYYDKYLVKEEENKYWQRVENEENTQEVTELENQENIRLTMWNNLLKILIILCLRFLH